jgi:hypothetical protein
MGWQAWREAGRCLIGSVIPSKGNFQGAAALRIRSAVIETHSNTMATAILADVNVTAAALQNVVPVSGITDLTTKTPPRRAIGDALKASRMLALVVLLEFVTDHADSPNPLTGKHVQTSISVHDLLGSLFHTVDVGGFASAFLPAHTANVAELGFTFASDQG